MMTTNIIGKLFQFWRIWSTKTAARVRKILPEVFPRQHRFMSSYKGSEAQLKKNTYFFASEAGADKRSEKKRVFFYNC